MIPGGQACVSDVDGSWFSRSLHVPWSAKRQVETQLDGYCELLRAYFERTGITDVNLHLSGSLARQEPAVSVASSGVAQLASDVDLVAVTDGEPDVSHPVHGVVAEMRRRAPEMVTTMFVVRAANLARVHSLFGRDLWIGRLRPIVHRFEAEHFPEPPAGRRELFESLVHHLAGYLLLPAADSAPPHSRVTTAFQRTKLALDALRMFLVPMPGQPVSFADLPASHPTSAMREVIARAELESLIEAREMSLPDAVTPQRTEELVVGGLRGVFGVPESADDTVLLDRLAARADGCSHVLGLFQVALAALFLLVRADSGNQRATVDLFLGTWRRLDRSLLVEARAVADAVTHLDPRLIATADRGTRETVFDAMRLLRLDYYHYLGPHNFGAKPVPEYRAFAGDPA
ncbi:MAG: hypothetical protein QOF58_4373 [Pseudonocardiales bacterium]|nr:hypothetical protein [Pseudonocardiales bacterium]